MQEENAIRKDAHRGVIAQIVFALLIALTAFLIIVVKVITFKGVNLVYAYTILVTTFMFTRITGSFFYKSPSEKLNKDYTPSISFIIPCKNEEKAIYNTISKCAGVDYPKEKIEIITINDGSTDKTLLEMERAKKDNSKVKITIIEFKINKGKREGMVAGIRKSKGEIIIQLDSDSYPEKDAIRYLVSPFRDKKIAAVTAHSEPDNKDKNILTKIQAGYYFASFRALKATESMFDMVFCCSGCCSAYRKEYILPVLGEWRNEMFLGKKATYGDDRALTNRMLERGYKTIYCSDAHAYTIVPEKPRQLFKQQIRWKKSWIINSVKMSRYIAKKDLFVALTYFFPLFLITFMNPLISFKALILNPIVFGIHPGFYIAGVLLVSLLLVFHSQLYGNGKYGKYLIIWNVLNMAIFCYLIIYALLNLGNRSWGTR